MLPHRSRARRSALTEGQTTSFRKAVLAVHFFVFAAGIFLERSPTYASTSRTLDFSRTDKRGVSASGRS